MIKILNISIKFVFIFGIFCLHSIVASDTFKYLPTRINVAYDIHYFNSDINASQKYKGIDLAILINSSHHKSIVITATDVGLIDKHNPSTYEKYRGDNALLYNINNSSLQDKLLVSGKYGEIRAYIINEHYSVISIDIDENKCCMINIKNQDSQNKFSFVNPKDYGIENTLYAKIYKHKTQEMCLLIIDDKEIDNDDKHLQKLLESQYKEIFVYKDCVDWIDSLTPTNSSSSGSKTGSINNSSNESNVSKSSTKSTREQKREAKHQKRLLKQQHMMKKKSNKKQKHKMRVSNYFL